MTEPEPTLGVVIEALQNLKEQNGNEHKDMKRFVDEGFSRITLRQDIANGRTSKMERQVSFLKGAGAIIVMGAPAIAWFISFYFDHIKR